jgi:hypothetical protein
MPSRISTSLPFTEFTVADGNYDETRKPIDRVIIHTVVGTKDGAIARFSTIGTKVSAHYIVDWDGKLYHGLEETFTAYQAGDYAMNQRSIGVEHSDLGNYNGTRPDTLYKTSAALVADICTFYNIPIDRQHILKHSEVHPTGCPDALDVERIVREAKILATPLPEPNPGYAPTFEGQTVTKDGVTYHAYKNTQGVLLWLIQAPPAPTPIPPPPPTIPVDYPSLVKRIHDITWGPGYWWTRLNAIKVLLPK